MSEIALPTDAEGQDLGWHALNYRTAHTVHAQAMYEELERYVRAAILAERERCACVCDKRAEDCQDDHSVDGDERWLVYANHAARLAAAIRRGSV